MGAPQSSLGAWSLEEVVGRGAVGEVWRARHARSGSLAAVKVVPRAAHDPLVRAAFRTEVRAVAALDHPHVVRVWDQGEVPDGMPGFLAGAPWLAMEWAPGGTLASDPPSDWAGLKRTLWMLLDALAAAHAAGIVHRDVKPANVLRIARTPDAELRLADFGVAALADPDATSSSIAGTPHYMAPEQASGTTGLGPWTDLYAVGCVAYTLATGRPPFTGGLYRVLAGHRERPVPALVPRMPVPRGFEGWVHELLGKRPWERPGFAAIAAARLGALDDPTDSPPRSVLAPPTPSAPTWTEDGPAAADPSPPERASSHGFLLECPPGWERPRSAEARVPASLVGPALFGVRTVPLVDRDHERTALWAALRDVVATGVPRAIVLDGGSGFGKSRLARWLCERAHELGVATWAQATHAPVSGPEDGLSPMIARWLGIGWRADVAERARLVLRHLPTDLVRALVALIDGAEAPARGERIAVVRAALAAAPVPTIVWVDDAQWASEAVDLVQGLLTGGNGVPVLAVLTVRADEDGPGVERVRRLLALPRVDRLSVGPLPETQRRELVAGLLGLRGGLAAEVVQRSQGNAAFAVGLVGGWVSSGALRPGNDGFELVPGEPPELPEGLVGVWRQRVERWASTRSPADRVAIEAAAVLGIRVDPTEWVRACEQLGVPADPRLVDGLAAGGLAVTRAGQPGWAFAQAMLREAFVQGAVSRSTELHAAAAAAIDPDDNAHAARRGHHLIAAGRASEASAPLLVGARFALEYRFDVDAAETLADRVRTLLADLSPDDPRHVGLLLLVMFIAVSRARLEAAEAAAGELVAHRGEPGWERGVAEGVRMLGQLRGDIRGQFAEAVALYEEAEGLARAVGDVSCVVRSRIGCGYSLLPLGRGDEAEALLRGSLIEAAGLDATVRGRVLRCLGTIVAERDPPAARALLAEAVEVLTDAGLVVAAALARADLAAALRLGGDDLGAEIEARVASERMHAAGHLNASVADLVLALALAGQGRHAEAASVAAACTAAFAEQRRTPMLCVAWIAEAWAAAGSGDLPAFDRILDRLMPELERLKLVEGDVEATLLRIGAQLVAAGEHARADRLVALLRKPDPVL